MLRKIFHSETKYIFILVLLGIAFSVFLCYIGSQSCQDSDTEIVITVTPTVTPTITNTPTPTPTPTNTPTPTVTPIPSPTPEPMVLVTDTPDMSQELYKMALEEVDARLELMAKEPPTLYTTYTEEELELLFRVVEAEATDYCIECKSHVASVIFNRLKEGWWGGDLTSSIMAKRQFEVITNGRYKKVTITEETILACEIAFVEDTAQGALFFDSTKGNSWAHRNRDYIFSDHAHWFYK